MGSVDRSVIFLEWILLIQDRAFKISITSCNLGLMGSDSLAESVVDKVNDILLLITFNYFY